MEKVPLIDELLVIDSGSEDDTVGIAEAEGARVVQHADVLPRYGSYRGKGEALWKSLLRDHPATSSPGPTRTSATGTRASCTGRSVRC